MTHSKVEDRLSESEKIINREVASSLRYLCQAANITRSSFEHAFTGISYATWRNYLNEDYPNNRSVSVLAAFSWYIGLSMNSFYLGSRLKHFLGLTDDSLRLLTLMSGLNTQQFDIACQTAFALLEPDQQSALRTDYLDARQAHLNIAGQCDFVAPLDIADFSRDYCQSCAWGFQRIQAKRAFSDAEMAETLGVSVHRYQRISDPEDTLPISAAVAARMKIGFELEDTSFMLERMRTYPQFRTLRQYQEKRDAMLRPLLGGLSETSTQKLSRALKVLFR